MKWLALLLVCSCHTAIGALSPRELVATGRPREALRALERDEASGGDRRLLVLHRAALLHAASDWAGSDAALEEVERTSGRFVDRPLVAKLRAVNALAMRGDSDAFAAAFPKRPLALPAPGWGKVVVVFERGGQVSRMASRGIGARWQLDDGAPAEVTVADSMAHAPLWWSAPSHWAVGDRDVRAGPHVVTVSTVAGRRAQVVDVVAGNTVFIVVPQ